MKRAFTLVEMMVVLAMIMILAGALATSVAGARERAKITAATIAVQEMTKAILMYENYAETRDLSGVVREKQEATKSSMAFILGGGKTDLGGNKIPVLYNADIKGSRILDPWGNAYKVTIKQGTASIEQGAIVQATRRTSTSIPNFWRRNPDDPD